MVFASLASIEGSTENADSYGKKFKKHETVEVLGELKYSIFKLEHAKYNTLKQIGSTHSFIPNIGLLNVYWNRKGMCQGTHYSRL